MTPEKIAQIARVTHETNRAYCQTIGDDSQSPWDEAAEWQKSSAIGGVKFALNNPEVTPEQMHENWMRDKEADGWVFGPIKDVDLKEHPCMVPYSALPANQRVKDLLFRNIVCAMLTAEAESLGMTLCEYLHMDKVPQNNVEWEIGAEGTRAAGMKRLAGVEGAQWIPVESISTANKNH